MGPPAELAIPGSAGRAALPSGGVGGEHSTGRLVDMPYMSVTREEGGGLRVQTGHHSVLADLPVDAGGHDAGPSPTELFVAAVAACAAQAGRAFLHRRGGPEELEIGCHYELAADGRRVESIQLTLRVPDPLTPEARGQLLKEIDRCGVHASIAVPAQLHAVVLQRELEPGSV